MKKNKKQIFTQEEIDRISALGDVLRKILSRLLKEGKAKIENGKVVFLYDKKKKEHKD